MTTDQKNLVLHLRGIGKSYSEISEALGVSVNTISSFCRRLSIGGHSKDIQSIETCQQCGKLIKSKVGHKQRQFCSDACRLLWWNTHLDRVKRKAVYTFTCACCGKEFVAYGNSHRKYCSHACYITDRYNPVRLAND